MQSIRPISSSTESHFVRTAESEHTEMYLKAIWHLLENNEEPKVSYIAKKLHIKTSSAVQMLRKLESQKLVTYTKLGVHLTSDGHKTARQIIRNCRLFEVLMESSLKLPIDNEMICGIEHHLDEKVSNALCTMLNHPTTCPHGKIIPDDSCCHFPLQLNRQDKDSDNTQY